MLLLYLLLVLPSALCLSGDSSYIPPVVLVPGDGGSQMEARLDKPSIIHYVCARKTDTWFDLWLNMELLIPYAIDCWIDNMRLVYNNVTRKTSNSPGVEIRVPGFGNTSTVEWLDPSHNMYTGYFKFIVNKMVDEMGYVRGMTVRGAPFDFRRAPNEHGQYFKRLKWLVEDTYKKGNSRRVVLLVHSMGGPMMWYFLKEQPQWWKTRYIEALVGLAGAWGGSIKAAKVYTAGDNLGIYFLESLKVRAEQRTAPSLAFLLPSRDIYGPEDVFVQTPTKNYTVDNFKDLFEALNLPDAYNMYLDTRDLLKGAPPPGVPVHCLYGVGIKTVERVVYGAAGNFPDSPSIVTGDGDGTVNLRSAQVCENWAGKQSQPVVKTAFNNMEHMDILKSPGPIEKVLDIIKTITEENRKKMENKQRRQGGISRMVKRKKEKMRNEGETTTEINKAHVDGNTEGMNEGNRYVERRTKLPEFDRVPVVFQGGSSSWRAGHSMNEINRGIGIGEHRTDVTVPTINEIFLGNWRSAEKEIKQNTGDEMGRIGNEGLGIDDKKKLSILTNRVIINGWGGREFDDGKIDLEKKKEMLVTNDVRSSWRGNEEGTRDEGGEKKKSNQYLVYEANEYNERL